ncbi:ATPase [Fusobacterium nucleatum]|uniref:ATPase n=1 Tax=Fusobacterium nucleatum TaxID=851 RepID=UPI0012381E7F|nr:ATPase [Fusobacterium nucleatum]
MLDEFLKNELSFNRESGTYLFYGDDLEKNYSIALEFSAELFSRNIENKNEKNKITDKTFRNLYSDLMVVDNLNIDTVREIIKKSYTSSHEGGVKVFILKNIQDIRKESANAMLKLIEEPTKDNFFVLISKRLNILSTIKSRSIIYRIRKSTPEELGVDRYIYNFFLGFSNDIEKYKGKEIDLMLEKSYTAIGGVLKEYEKEKNIEVKIDLYKCLRNFVQESSNLKKYEKIKFAEDIYLNSSKESTSIIVEYLINLVKRDKNLKEKLEYKKMLRYPVNIKLLLINLIMSI